jgi:hypothetical protein
MATLRHYVRLTTAARARAMAGFDEVTRTALSTAQRTCQGHVLGDLSVPSVLSPWQPRRSELVAVLAEYHSETQPCSFRATHTRAFGLQKGCRAGAGRRWANAISLQIAGGRTWIRTRDLFLIREAL